MKKNLLFSVIFFIALNISAQIPNGYYNGTDGLSGESLKAALHNIIKGHKAYPYSSSSTDTWDVIKEADKDPANSANVILIYKGNSVNAAQEYNNGAGWNREHIWAKSHGGFDTDPPAGTDIHHLRASDISVNADRGNLDFDIGGTAHSEATGCNYDSDSWEPRDEVKGDVARMMFYMATRYEGDITGEPDLELVDYITGSTTEPIFGKLSTLLEWHEQDPVDDFEKNRNDVVYSFQNNRNPFIDHPEFVCLIWGNNCTNAVEDPVISPSGTNFSQSIEVSITCVTEGALIYYTIDGTTPTVNSTLYSSSITLTETKTVKAIAVKENLTSSNIVSETFTLASINTALNEDFESLSATNVDFQLANWSTFLEKGTRNWQAKEYSSNKYIQYSAHQSTDAENIAWVITPQVDLSTYTNPALSFNSKDGYNNGNPMKLYVSETYNGSDPTQNTWTELNATFASGTTTGYATTFTASENISLKSFVNKNVHIAFVYSGSASGGITTTMQLDDIKIFENETNTAPEIGTISYSPQNPETGQNITITSEVTDVDNNLQTVKVIYSLNSENLDNELSMSASGNTYSASINAAVSGTLNFKIIATDSKGLETSSVLKTITINEAISYILHEDFETTTEYQYISLENWLNIAEVGNSKWEARLYNENKYAQFSAFNSGDESNISWLISPEIDLSTIYNGVLEFESKDGFSNGDPIQLLISSDFNGSDIGTANWTELDATFSNGTTSGYADNFVSSGNVDLKDYYGKKVRIAFKYTGGSNSVATTIQIDNIKITGEENIAPSIGDINYNPANPESGSTITIDALITDEDGTISEANLYYSYNGSNSFTKLNMSASNSVYSASFSLIESGTLSFYVEAKDDKGSIQTSETQNISILTSVFDSELNKFTIYPNPTKAYLYIDNNLNINNIRIFNLSGKLIKSVEIKDHKIDLNSLEKGVYFIQFETNIQTYMKKIIKE